MAANPWVAITSAEYLAEVVGPTVWTSRVITSRTCTTTPLSVIGTPDARAVPVPSPGTPGSLHGDVRPCRACSRVPVTAGAPPQARERARTSIAMTAAHGAVDLLRR